MNYLNPELYFLKRANRYYVFSPQNSNILNVSRSIFESLRKNQLNRLKEEHFDILKSNQVIITNDLENNKCIPNLTLKLTSRCNFNCRFCSQKGLPMKGLDMDLSTAKLAIDKFLRLKQNHYNIGFFGGEPLLRANLIKQLINYSKKRYAPKRITYELNTNGFLLGQNITWLDKQEIVLAVSVRGDKAYYLKNKELDRYNKIFNSLKKFKNKKNIILNIVVESSNINCLDSLVSEFNSIGIKEFALCIPSFNLSLFWKGKEELFAIKLMNLFTNCFRKGINLIFSDWGFWSNRKYNCRALSGTSIYVNTNGDIDLCHSISLPLGNITKNSIQDVLITPEKFPSYIKKEINFCNHCNIKHFCRGGCLADKHLRRKANPTFCKFAKTFFKLYLDYLINQHENCTH